MKELKDLTVEELIKEIEHHWRYRDITNPAIIALSKKAGLMGKADGGVIVIDEAFGEALLKAALGE